MSGSSTCRSCGRPIVWTKTQTGKNSPVDPDPVPDGNLVLVSSTVDGKVHFEQFAYRPEAHNAERKRYRSHFATCPNAKQHRRPR